MRGLGDARPSAPVTYQLFDFVLRVGDEFLLFSKALVANIGQIECLPSLIGGSFRYLEQGLHAPSTRTARGEILSILLGIRV